MDFHELFGRFRNIKVAVVGDVMLDTYLWGRVDRISPEAPVPVIALYKKDYRLGGAANVALNLRSLDAQVAMFSVIGADDDAEILRQRFRQEGISDSWLIGSPGRVTTNKSRVISRNQQMLRMDAEMTEDLNAADEAALTGTIEAYIVSERPQVLIFEDYNKGVLTDTVIRRIIDICHQHQVITAVDPKRKNFFSYKGVTIFKPNLKEVTEAFNLIQTDVTPSSLAQIHELLSRHLNHTFSFITLSEKGVFYNGHAGPVVIPSHLRNISDVSGAGDTVIAVASLLYAATGDVHLMAQVANIAGGLVCEEVGTVAINRERLLEECRGILSE